MPNDTVYAETCASIGLIFFAQRMLQLEAKSDYADVMERALYNNVIGSMSQDGKHYFYVNPLEVWPKASRIESRSSPCEGGAPEVVWLLLLSSECGTPA